MTAARPMPDPPARVRQRQRASGGWRIWWEPEAAVRHLGFATVELDPKRLTWSAREAARLNALVAGARQGVAPAAVTGGGRTVAALIAAFMASPGWAQLRPDTQRDYRGGFRIIETKWGGWPLALFRRGIVLEWSETLTRDHGQHQAKSVIRKLSLLMSYAERREWIDANPCLRLRIPTPKPRDRVVAWEEFDALMAAARSLNLGGMVLAIAMGWWTGQRRRDIITATVGQIGADRAWRFTRSKARDGSAQAAGAIAIHAELWPLIAARLDVAATPGAPLCFDAATAAAISDDLFGKRFAAVRDAAVAAGAASCADIQFRDLRRSWAHWSREGGASDRDRADGMGNQSDKNARLSQTYNPPTMAGATRAVDAIQRPRPAKRAAGGE
jgi:integrase